MSAWERMHHVDLQRRTGAGYLPRAIASSSGRVLVEVFAKIDLKWSWIAFSDANNSLASLIIGGLAGLTPTEALAAH